VNYEYIIESEEALEEGSVRRLSGSGTGHLRRQAAVAHEAMTGTRNVDISSMVNYGGLVPLRAACLWTI
jgi:hypothetical protein